MLRTFRFLFLVLPVLAAYHSAYGQSAALNADTTSLSPTGGTAVLTASATYDGQPAALGWSVALPADWTLVSVGGPNVPQIAPEPGSTGTLEFAYTTSPAHAAAFSLTVRYPAAVKNATATPNVIIRTNGKLVTLSPMPVVFSRAVPDPQRRYDK